MAGKLTAGTALTLGLCYDKATADAAVAAGGKSEYTVDEVLLGNFISHDDAMFFVCRDEVTPTKVLRDFAALVAREALKTVTSGIPNATPFVKAVAFLEEGDADDRPEELAEHAESVQRFMVSALVIEGTGDWTKPDLIAKYETLLKAAKVVRAALKPGAGEAAYAAAHRAYMAVKGSARDSLGQKHRVQLAKIFMDHTDD